MKKIITNSVTETLVWAQQLAEKLKGGEVFSLEGELGVGKTIVAKGLASGLGVNEVVNSPTFVLMKVYKTTHPKIKRLVHVDAYRLEWAAELLDIGLGDFLGDKSTVVLIEWGDKVKNILPRKTKFIKLKQLAENQREIIIGN